MIVHKVFFEHREKGFHFPPFGCVDEEFHKEYQIVQCQVTLTVLHVNTKNDIFPCERTEQLNFGWQPVLQILPECHRVQAVKEQLISSFNFSITEASVIVVDTKPRPKQLIGWINIV